MPPQAVVGSAAQSPRAMESLDAVLGYRLPNHHDVLASTEPCPRPLFPSLPLVLNRLLGVRGLGALLGLGSVRSQLLIVAHPPKESYSQKTRPPRMD